MNPLLSSITATAVVFLLVSLVGYYRERRLKKAEAKDLLNFIRKPLFHTDDLNTVLYKIEYIRDYVATFKNPKKVLKELGTSFEDLNSIQGDRYADVAILKLYYVRKHNHNTDRFIDEFYEYAKKSNRTPEQLGTSNFELGVLQDYWNEKCEAERCLKFIRIPPEVFVNGPGFYLDWVCKYITEAADKDVAARGIGTSMHELEQLIMRHQSENK